MQYKYVLRLVFNKMPKGEIVPARPSVSLLLQSPGHSLCNYEAPLE